MLEGLLFSSILPISSIFIGYQITLFFTRFRLNSFELIGASFPVGVTLSSLFSLIFNPFLKCSQLHFYVITLMSFILAIIFFLLNRRLHHQFKLPKVATLLWILVCSSGFIYVIYQSYIAEKGKMLLSGKNDLFLEISYISSFIHGINNDKGFITQIYLPCVSGNIGKSEYLPTIYLALLSINGLSIEYSIFIVTVLLFISIEILQFSFTLRLCNSEYAAALSIPVVFLSGGFGFLHFLNSHDRHNPSVDYIFMLSNNKYNSWGHPLLHCILTSRCVQLTMALSILSFILFECRSDVFAIFLMFSVLIIRPQTGFALFLCSILFKFKLTRIVVYAILTVIVYVLLPIFGVNPKMETAIYWNDMYRNTLFPFISFPLSVLGVLFVTSLLSFFEFKSELISALFTFYVLSFVRLQLNIRFNFFALLSTVVPVFIAISFAFISRIAQRIKNAEVQGSLFAFMFFGMIFMCLSSIAGIYAKFDQKFVTWDNDDQEIANWIIQNTTITDVFCGSVLDGWNPAIVLAGRQLYFGTIHWMQSVYFELGDKESNYNYFEKEAVPIRGVDYYIYPNNGRWAKKVTQLIGSMYLPVHQNEKYIILKSAKQFNDEIQVTES